jgi:hypothetical protein
MESIEKNYQLLHSFLGIPYSEKTVPFPNWWTVFRQHYDARPEQAALQDGNHSINYGKLLGLIERGFQLLSQRGIRKGDSVTWPWKGTLSDQLLLLTLLAYGAPVIFAPERAIPKMTAVLTLSDDDPLRHLETEPAAPIPEAAQSAKMSPYINLSDAALICRLADDSEILFSQYNLLNAAQSLGKIFNLFRSGAALTPRLPLSVSELSLSLLAPIYFGKEIQIEPEIPTSAILEKICGGIVHFCYLHQPEKLISTRYQTCKTLRDATLLLNLKNSEEQPFPKNAFIKGIFPLDEMAGVGPIISQDAIVLETPASELILKNTQLHIRGHSLFDAALPEKFRHNLFKYQWIPVTNWAKFQRVEHNEKQIYLQERI